MSAIRRGSHRAIMFGRRVSPLSFWVGYLDLVLLAGITMSMVVSTDLDTGVGRWLVPFVLMVVGLLIAGFWSNNPRLMSWGLLLSAGTWATVAAAVLPETWHTSIFGWMAIGLVGLTLWAWWIEEGEVRG